MFVLGVTLQLIFRLNSLRKRGKKRHANFSPNKKSNVFFVFDPKLALGWIPRWMECESIRTQWGSKMDLKNTLYWKWSKSKSTGRALTLRCDLAFLAFIGSSIKLCAIGIRFWCRKKCHHSRERTLARLYIRVLLSQSHKFSLNKAIKTFWSPLENPFTRSSFVDVSSEFERVRCYIFWYIIEFDWN